MVSITRNEFTSIREAVSGAHVLIQSLVRVLRQRAVILDKQQRNLLQVVPESVQQAFHTLSEITRREDGAPGSDTQTETLIIDGMDLILLQDEIDNVAALSLPDVQAIVCTSLLNNAILGPALQSPDANPTMLAKAFCTAWEAGRRYGIHQSMAILESATAEYLDGTNNIMEYALNSNLSLPAPGLPFPAKPTETCDCEDGKEHRADCAQNKQTIDGAPLPAPKLELVN